MKSIIYIFIGLILISCEKTNRDTNELVDFEEIELECINKASEGGSISVRIDTQEEYDSLYYYRYTKPLNDWLNDNYNSLIDGVIRNYPDAMPDEYDSILVNDYVYNFAPFLWVKDCNHPAIDFDKYTLLGQSIFASGCSTPKLETEVYINYNKKELTFLTNVETYGSCEMGFGFNVWILVDKLSSNYTVNYQSIENNVEIY